MKPLLVVIAICKDTKLKAIHNRKAAVLSILSLERLHFFNPLLLQDYNKFYICKKIKPSPAGESIDSILARRSSSL